ncbi:MAG: universal stress protein [Pseudomonadota bacterium]
MYQNILVPVALGHPEQAIDAIQVADKMKDASGQLTVLHIIEQLPTYVNSQIPDGLISQMEEDAEAGLNQVVEQCGVEVSAKVVFGHPGRSICEYAEDHRADCIVIASHRPGLADYLIGSTAARVVRHAQCCVHVIR